MIKGLNGSDKDVTVLDTETAQPVSRSARRVLLVLAKYFIGVTALTYVIWKNWDEINEALKNPIQPGPVVWAFTASFIGIILTFLRWYVLVRAQDLPFSVADSLRLGAVGFFSSNFLPGAIGGDLVKAAFLAKEQSRRTVAVATVLVDRAMGLWGLVWAVAVVGALFWLFGNEAILASETLKWVVTCSVAVVVVSLGAWLLLGVLSSKQADQLADRLSQIPKVGHAAAEMWRALWMYRCRGWYLTLALVMAMATHCFLAIAFFYAGHIFRHAESGIPTLPAHFVFFPIGEIFQVFFPSPGGMGGSEWAFGKAYMLVGFQNDVGTRVALTYRIITTSWSIVGLLVYYCMKPSAQPAPERKKLVSVEA